jgi:hypothetical protein
MLQQVFFFNNFSVLYFAGLLFKMWRHHKKFTPQLLSQLTTHFSF